jgi:hypothetical protein
MPPRYPTLKVEISRRSERRRCRHERRHGSLKRLSKKATPNWQGTALPHMPTWQGTAPPHVLNWQRVALRHIDVSHWQRVALSRMKRDRCNPR